MRSDKVKTEGKKFENNASLCCLPADDQIRSSVEKKKVLFQEANLTPSLLLFHFLLFCYLNMLLIFPGKVLISFDPPALKLPQTDDLHFLFSLHQRHKTMVFLLPLNWTHNLICCTQEASHQIPNATCYRVSWNLFLPLFHLDLKQIVLFYGLFYQFFS